MWVGSMISSFSCLSYAHISKQIVFELSDFRQMRPVFRFRRLIKYNSLDAVVPSVAVSGHRQVSTGQQVSAVIEHRSFSWRALYPHDTTISRLAFDNRVRTCFFGIVRNVCV